ncbi:MAG: DUF368 domain-containing protein [Candidatus Cryptobacteroides sp.]
MNKLGHNIGVAAKGFAMGAANVIPGVSGGTIALLTGIFNELIGALNAILTPKAWKLLFKGSFREFWEHIHGTFLLWLGAGVVASIFSLAKLMEYVLSHHPVQTWAFFFGLILVSAIFMLADIKGKKPADLAWLVLGAALGATICLLSPSSTPDSPWFIAVCGAIAICTMILPGISGSFILVLLGKYDYIMSAVSNLDIPVLLVFAVGCVVGIIAFSKILHWLIAHYEKQTLLVLIGFTVGSLVKVWPWADKAAYEAANVLTGCPAGDLHVLPAVICAVLAGAVVVVLEVLAHRRK